MTQLILPLITENIPGSDTFVRLREDFSFHSDVLGRDVLVPSGMVFDLESVPLLRGTCPEAGCGHDYLCRKDSDPVVSKSQAAQVYFELLDHVYTMDDRKGPRGVPDRIIDTGRKWVKWTFVYLWPGYFHRHRVMDSYAKITKWRGI